MHRRYFKLNNNQIPHENQSSRCHKKEDKFEIQELTLAPLKPREVLAKSKSGICAIQIFC
jgi:hypothetical protein